MVMTTALSMVDTVHAYRISVSTMNETDWTIKIPCQTLNKRNDKTHSCDSLRILLMHWNRASAQEIMSLFSVAAWQQGVGAEEPGWLVLQQVGTHAPTSTAPVAATNAHVHKYHSAPNHTV